MTGATDSGPPWRRLRPVPIPSDERLAKRAAAGDQRAFAAIYDRHHQGLYRFCLAIVRNREDAEDALQSTMVKLLRSLPGEAREIQLKPWLYRIAHNEAIEVLRRRRDSVELDPELIAAGGDPSETAATRQRLRRLLGDLAELPDRQRSALVLRELSGLSFGQIAATFETSEAAIRQTVYEARLNLRQIETGREMNCKKVMWELSEADGRVTRRRDLQAHLRACPECRVFQDEIAKRRGDLAAIAPLPLAASAALLKGVLGGGVGAASGAVGGGAAGAVGGGAAGAIGAGAGGGSGAGAAGGAALSGAAVGGKAAATSVALKAVATVAVVAVGATAADRGGLIETPLPASIGGEKAAKSTTEAAPEGAAQTSPAGAQPGGESRQVAGSPADGRSGEAGSGKGSKSEAKAKDAADGPAGKGASGEPAPASGARNPNAKGAGRAQGRPDGPPAGTAHGQKAAGARATKQKGAGAKDSQGKAAKSKGAGKPSGAAKGPSSQGNPSHSQRHPSHGANADSKTESPIHQPEGGAVGPDKATTAPFQPPKPEMSKGAPLP